MQKAEKPQVGQFHKQTMEYIARRRKQSHQVNSMELPMPKAFGEKRLSQLEKVDLIREQVKRIERIKESEKIRIKAKHLEDQEIAFTETQKAKRQLRT